ncbi:amino acid ABC transporter substrate-binding protein [Aquabacterium sp.]|uniref:amino acid ABC transporter substrate-binding protein n=1 Tax=Aquabacterium sp. TaxID=1872578 RepID=UPI002BF54902|nr:amino acid ABC transporter substrate-binding protein [Aquabacterium sp.]HSW03069.1 amino acid ABC transporter substrate-binding protein [Aquabacterium sp.]
MGRLIGVCLLTAVTQGAFAQTTDTLKKIRETGVIVIGYRVGSIPFSYLDATLKPIGYSMDLCMRVVDSLRQTLTLPELKVKLVAVTAATRIPLVANGTVDLECGVTTHTLERRKLESFTVTTFVARSRLLSKKSAGIRTLDDLRGRTVVSTVGTTSIQRLTAINAERALGMRIIIGKDDAESLRMVQTDRAAAFAMDDVLLYSLLADVSDHQAFTISSETLSVEPYAIALGKDDPAFKTLVDAVIIGLFRSAEIDILYRRWFESPIPPNGMNLQLPMSPALRRVINAPTDSGDPRHYE